MTTKFTTVISNDLPVRVNIQHGPTVKVNVVSGPRITSKITPSPRGKSAYEIWIGQGNTGDVDDYLLSLKGEPGSSEYLNRWIDYVTGYTAAPTLLVDLADYQVFQYGYTNNLVLYRKISKTNLYDEFYNTYINGTLSNLLVKKQL